MANQLISVVSSRSGPLRTRFYVVQTTDASAFTVDIPVEDNTVDDLVVTFTARDASNNGDYARAYYETTYQRFGAANVSGTDPTAQFARTNGGGSAYALAISKSTTNIRLTFTGVVATTINWTVTFQEALQQ